MKRAIYIVLQCSWGILQTLVGAVIFLICIKRPHYRIGGAAATVWRNKTSASLGLFIFVTEHGSEKFIRLTEAHEYGHTIQSLILGPLYLPVIALPSMIWCALPPLKSYREKKRVSYHIFYTERSANYLGRKILKRETFDCKYI